MLKMSFDIWVYCWPLAIQDIDDKNKIRTYVHPLGNGSQRPFSKEMDMQQIFS